MDSTTLRKKYFDFYQKKNHVLLPSSPLLPENDPTVLFTTAGMHPLVPYLLGSLHPGGKRLVDVQKCIRTQDIEEVGDAWHCTFFEMLGNWSLGDYFKEEAIAWTLEFLTENLGFPKDKLAITFFSGEGAIPGDNESYEIWRKFGFRAEQIFSLGKDDNFWGPVGNSGPCGPCSETFFITSDKCNFSRSDCSPACKCGRYVEICNNVFMQYNKKIDGSYQKLDKPNVDFGMGLLRVISVLNGYRSVYEADIYSEAMGVISEIAEAMELKQKRIITDHIQAAMFAINDGVNPSNIGAGYIVRRILRRSFRLANQYKMSLDFVNRLVDSFVSIYKNQYPDLDTNKSKILEVMFDEETKFSKALGQGLKYFEKELEKLPKSNESEGQAIIPGKIAFFMFETYGFPIEVTEELAKENGWAVDIQGYHVAYKEHQEKSRLAGDKLFKGGLADHSEAATKLHTATHLLHQALRQILGPHVEQRGSNITPERLRFDFSHPEKVTPDKLTAIEILVNEQIVKELEVKLEVMSVEEAKNLGAIGIFEKKYGEKVNVYSIGDFSKEICGGPHVTSLRELGKFKIKKEEASSAGIRRIKAVLE